MPLRTVKTQLSRKLHTKRKRSGSSGGTRKRQKMESVGTVKNPATGRQIEKYGPTYCKLKRTGVL